MPSGCLHERETHFQRVFGDVRGSDRTDVAMALPALSFRTVFHRSPEPNYDPVDALVAVCEKCGGVGFLLRDWDDVALPALCTDCYSQREGAFKPPWAEGFECEDWCDTDLDHDGLCRPS